MKRGLAAVAFTLSVNSGMMTRFIQAAVVMLLISAPAAASVCRSPFGDYEFTCPGGWAMSQDSEGTHFFQVNYKNPNNERINLNLRWYSYSYPHRRSDGLLDVYSNEDDFIGQTIANIYSRTFALVQFSDKTVLPEGPVKIFSFSALKSGTGQWGGFPTGRMGNLSQSFDCAVDSSGNGYCGAAYAFQHSFAVIPLNRGIYVLMYSAPVDMFMEGLPDYEALLKSFVAITEGPDGPERRGATGSRQEGAWPKLFLAGDPASRASLTDALGSSTVPIAEAAAAALKRMGVIPTREQLHRVVLQDFVNSGFTKEEAEAWSKLRTSAADAATLKNAGFVPPEANVWLSSGVKLNDMADWRKDGWSLADAVLMSNAGIGPEHASNWRKAGFKGKEAAFFGKAGILDPDDLKTWKDAGFSAKEAVALKKSGFNDIEKAQQYKNVGVTAVDAKLWYDASVPPENVTNAMNAGFTAQSARAWNIVGGFENETGLDVTKAALWKNAGFTPAQAYRMLDLQLPPEKASKYRDSTPRGKLALLVQFLRDQPNNHVGGFWKGGIEFSSGYENLRAKIIDLSLSLKPAPTVPEEAEHHMAAGGVAIREAKDVEGYREATEEFQQASLAAPWYGDAYYNLGVALNKAEDFEGAALSLRFYLQASPNAPDVPEAKKLLYELEYRGKKKGDLAQAEKSLEAMKGAWHFRHCNPEGNTGFGPGCRQDDKRSNWWGNDAAYISFIYPGNGTVEVPYEVAALAGSGVEKIVGHGNTMSFGGPVKEWECRLKDGSSVKVEDMGGIDYLYLSCDGGGPNPKDPAARYHYVKLYRKPLK